MGPLEGIGPYAEMSITTRNSDSQVGSDNEPGIKDFLIGLILFLPTLLCAWFMGLTIMAHIGPIVSCAVIGTAIWSCGHYGTNDSIVARFRYRPNKAQRAVIRRRLMGRGKISE